MCVGIDLWLEAVAGRTVRVDITDRAIGVVQKTLVGDRLLAEFHQQVPGDHLGKIHTVVLAAVNTVL